MTDRRNFPQVKIETDHGEFTVELWEDVAPGHVANFLKLTNSGFYDGLTFHRIIPQFMIQGGCPDGTGMGGPGWQIDAEFNDRPHQKGVLSMARSSDPNSAGSQFFVCLTRDYCKHLDGDYTAFGKVVEGIETIDKIAATPIADAQMGTPANPPKMTKVAVVGS